MMRKSLLLFVCCTATAIAGCNVKVGDVDDGGFEDAATMRDADVAPGVDSGADAAMSDAGESDAGMSGDDAGTVAGIEAWPALRAQATCDALLDCIGDEDLLLDTLGGRDCATLNESLLRNGELGYLAESVASERVLYRSEEEQNCVDDIRALGCDVRTTRLPASCELLLIGTVELGASCTINEDCAGDAYCDKGSLASCPGTCAGWQSEGMPCNGNDDEQCADGLVCFRDSCEPLGALSDSCGTDLPRCLPGLVCVDEGSGEHCVSIDALYFRALGEDCDVVTELCEPGLVCASVSGSIGECEERVAAGAECKRAQPNQCPAWQYCNAETAGEVGTCVDRPSDGEPCLSRAQACADEHVCVEGTCAALAQIGEQCTADLQCYSGACGEDELCAAPLMCTL